MAFQPEENDPNFLALKSTLTSSGIQKQNNPLYQTILQLIERVSKLKTILNQKIENITINIESLINQIIIIDNDKVDGPASATDNAIVRFDGITGKVIQEGANIINDDGTISNVTDPVLAQDAATKNYVDNAIAAASSVDHVVVSDGGIPEAKPINDGAGSFIYIPYAP